LAQKPFVWLKNRSRRKISRKKLTVFSSFGHNPAKYQPFSSIIKIRKKMSKQAKPEAEKSVKVSRIFRGISQIALILFGHKKLKRHKNNCCHEGAKARRLLEKRVR